MRDIKTKTAGKNIQQGVAQSLGKFKQRVF
jgi:hypothetical protein